MPAHAGRYQWHEEGTEADAHSDASTVSLEGSSYAKQARKFRGWSLCRRVMALPGGLALVAIGTTCFLGSVVVALPSLNALAGLLRQGQPPSDGSNALTASSADQTIGIRGGVLTTFEGTAAHTELTTEEGARKWGVGPSVGSVPISPSPLAPSPPTSPPPLTHGCAPGYYELVRGYYDCALLPIDDHRRCASLAWGPAMSSKVAPAIKPASSKAVAQAEPPPPMSFAERSSKCAAGCSAAEECVGYALLEHGSDRTSDRGSSCWLYTAKLHHVLSLVLH